MVKLRNILKITVLSLFSLVNYSALAQAGGVLTLDLDLENDGLSMSHNIENFFFAPTENFAPGSEENMNDMSYPVLRDHLIATALVRLDGEIVGVATETERVYVDEETGLAAQSMWVIRLNKPGLTGFIVVEQIEDASTVAGTVGEVLTEPEADWPDEWTMYLSSVEGSQVGYASEDLANYSGGIFEEYNGFNPGDLKNHGRFRGKIQFKIYPAN